MNAQEYLSSSPSSCAAASRSLVPYVGSNKMTDGPMHRRKRPMRRLDGHAYQTKRQ
ncbi:MAG: hypothetical protein JET69_04330 [Methanomassiliicoccales archaeon]|nr:hypothetical protein [Methanomassiliicoccales archaeon]